MTNPTRTTTRVLVRAAMAAAAAVGGLVILAQPASAHTVSGVGATNWKSVLTDVTPTRPGLTVRLVEDGSRIEVTNHGPEIMILGYQGEPYLRVGPQGVFENLHSASTYLNCSRAGCAIPGGVDLKGRPNGRRSRRATRRAITTTGPIGWGASCRPTWPAPPTGSTSRPPGRS